MVARNRIRCTIISVPVAGEVLATRGAVARELVPGADPYVVQLIKNLQDEVRQERRRRSLVKHYRPGAHNRLARHFDALGADGASHCDATW